MINNKEKYLSDINNRFSGKARDILIKQLDLFYEENNEVHKNKYKIGDDVRLSKRTFIHGIFGELDNFDFTLENGFVAVDFTSEPRANKICNSVGM